ncbi:MAG: hypothetical protein U9R50_03990 [Campylobacterota bacterium]|nr:hypothetical protein [Campylobacterota bacterium]
MSIQEILNDHGIHSIWHFTDRSNLSSIEQNGLLSLDSSKSVNGRANLGTRNHYLCLFYVL